MITPAYFADASNALLESDPGTVLDSKVQVSGPDKLLGRKSSGAGGHEEIDASGLTENATPGAGDWLVSYSSGGNLEKIDVGNLPGGGGGGGGDSLGTGFTGGGGVGTVPDETEVSVQAFQVKNEAFTAPNKIIFRPGGILDNIFADLCGILYTDTIFTGAVRRQVDDGKCIILSNQNEIFNGQLLSILPEGIEIFSKGPGPDETLRSKIVVSPERISIIFEYSFLFGFEMSQSGAIFRETRSEKKGLEYEGDYSDGIMANDRSIPDVGTTKKIQKFANVWDESTRPIPDSGQYPWGFNTTLGKHEGWDGTTWNSFY